MLFYDRCEVLSTTPLCPSHNSAMPCPPLLSIVYLIWAYYEFNPFVFVGYLNNCLHKSLARRSHRIEAAAASAHNFHSTAPPPSPTHTKLIPPNAYDAPCTPSLLHYFSSLLSPSRGQLLRRCSLSALSAAVWLRVCLPESELCSAAATCPRPLLLCPCALCQCLLQVEAGNINGRPITVGYSSDVFIYFGPRQTKLKFPLCSLRQILTAFK